MNNLKELNNLNEAWSKCLELLKLDMSNFSFKGYIEGLQPTYIDENTISLEVFDSSQLQIIEQKYKSYIEDALTRVTGKEISVKPYLTGDPTYGSAVELYPQKTKFDCGLKEKFGFDNFIVGKSNEYAYKAALNVAELPGKLHNPLFIYSAPGLGKTHLMQAIGNYILEELPNTNVIYVTSENFTNEFINFLSTKRNMYEFKEKYRKCDVLLIDDIHFLAGKEGTQEEFFHTFNELQNRDAQIVLTSDRPPRELSNLEERLVSRFGQGLTVDIMAPDFETRIAILKSKLSKEGMTVPNKVIEYIANTIKTNIRDLEGCVQRLKFYSKLNPDKTVDVEFTKEAFKGLYDGDKPRLISPKQIKAEVCDYFSVSIDDLEGKKRTASIVLPRQIAQYLIRSLTDMSYPNIAEEFKADYTTVIHNCNKIEKEMHSDIHLRKQIEDLSSIINR